MNLAERELGAFLYAVTELYGPEEAKMSAHDWVDELELLECLPGPTPREWRLLTIAAAHRLSKRVNGQSAGRGLLHT
jgi:hypothetical protein